MGHADTKVTGGDWNNQSLGSRFKYGFFYVVIKWLGLWPAQVFLCPVVLYYTLKPSVRRRSRAYLERRFPEASGLALWRHAFRLNLNFGLILLERASMGLTGRMRFDDAPEDLATVASLLGEGRGLLILTAHVGSWQTGMGGLAAAGIRLNIVQRRDNGDIDRHYFEHRPGFAAPNIIDASEPVASLGLVSAALLRGETVCLMGDRVRHGDALTLEADFLGGRIRLPGAPFFLAGRHQTPLAVIFTSRRKTSRVAERIYGVLRVPADAGRDPDKLQPHARRFAKALEEFVAEHPYQFFNYYDLWRKEDENDGSENPD